LDDLYRIAHRGYEPTDDDVVRARLRTMGVQEYRFLFETGEHLYLRTLEDVGMLIFFFNLKRAGGGVRVGFLRRRRVSNAREYADRHVDHVRSSPSLGPRLTIRFCTARRMAPLFHGRQGDHLPRANIRV
jgi:hypothetical protein